jgi:hypothetical protein
VNGKIARKILPRYMLRGKLDNRMIIGPYLNSGMGIDERVLH